MRTRTKLIIIAVVATLILGLTAGIWYLFAPQLACCPSHGGNTNDPCHAIDEDEQCPAGQIRGTCECPASVHCPPGDPGECVLCSCV